MSNENARRSPPLACLDSHVSIWNPYLVCSTAARIGPSDYWQFQMPRSELLHSRFVARTRTQVVFGNDVTLCV